MNDGTMTTTMNAAISAMSAMSAVRADVEREDGMCRSMS
jgi:hypothetical protein